MKNVLFVIIFALLLFGCAPSDYDDLPNPPQLPPTGEPSGDLVGEAYAYETGYASPYNVYVTEDPANPELGRVLKVTPESIGLDYVDTPSQTPIEVTVAGNPATPFTYAIYDTAYYYDRNALQWTPISLTGTRIRTTRYLVGSGTGAVSANINSADSSLYVIGFACWRRQRTDPWICSPQTTDVAGRFWMLDAPGMAKVNLLGNILMPPPPINPSGLANPTNPNFLPVATTSPSSISIDELDSTFTVDVSVPADGLTTAVYNKGYYWDLTTETWVEFSLQGTQVKDLSYLAGGGATLTISVDPWANGNTQPLSIITFSCQRASTNEGWVCNPYGGTDPTLLLTEVYVTYTTTLEAPPTLPGAQLKAHYEGGYVENGNIRSYTTYVSGAPAGDCDFSLTQCPLEAVGPTGSAAISFDSQAAPPASSSEARLDFAETDFTNKFTISAFVKKIRFFASGPLLTSIDEDAADKSGFKWSIVDSGSGVGVLSFVSTTDGVAQTSAFSTSGVTLGNFHHVAVVVDKTAGTVHQYIDGVLADSTTSLNVGFDSVGVWRLGNQFRSQATVGNPANAVVDDLKIYSGALNAAQVNCLSRNVDPLTC